MTLDRKFNDGDRVRRIAPDTGILGRIVGLSDHATPTKITYLVELDSKSVIVADEALLEEVVEPPRESKFKAGEMVAIVNSDMHGCVKRVIEDTGGGFGAAGGFIYSVEANGRIYSLVEIEIAKITPANEVADAVNHPSYYGGADNPYEAIKVIEAWGLGFCLGNAMKYISRAGKKDGEAILKDLKKAKWYLDHEIERLEKK